MEEIDQTVPQKLRPYTHEDNKNDNYATKPAVRVR